MRTGRLASDNMIQQSKKNGLRRAVVEHPLIKKLTRIPLKINQNYYKHFQYNDHYRPGCDLFREDWDNVILIDGCRYDIFAHELEHTGQLTRKYSRGSSTPQFVKANFSDVCRKDVVFVTGSENMYYQYREDSEYEFHKTIHINENDAFDGEFKSGELIAKYAKAAAKKYPDKKLIVHLLQPHHPFFTSDGKELLNIFSKYGVEMWIDGTKTTREEFTNAYVENVRYAINTAMELAEQFTGKTVITSDHGHGLGERMTPMPYRNYEHRPYLYTRELLEVPWFVPEFTERKSVQSDPTDGNEFISTSKTSEI